MEHNKRRRAIKSATDADAMIQHLKTPRDDARQTEGLLKGAADRTHQQANPTTR